MSNHNKQILLQETNKSHQVKNIKKIIDDQERWFEEIIEYYEEVVYEYDEQDPDELSLGSQMDLEQLIENYDIPEDCYEENVSLYEYYDALSEETQKNENIKKSNQKTENENNFQVYNLGEEEFITLIDDQNEIIDEDILTLKKPIDQNYHSKSDNQIKNKTKNKTKMKNKSKKKKNKKQKKKQK
ncbi:unnamed protein product [Paramecium sonneborni]|uniref:Uncharacterized protein n=1 Tax=Paramecium sonneborni TaxID=65129 RepID=A0A8S1RGA8_9CILI|nr:unnamed protein product [Paramecium sonneborni]